MKCKKCNKELPEKSQYCSYCGAKQPVWIDFTDSVKKALEGKEEGYNFIYEHTFSYMSYLVNGFFPNKADKEEALQEVYFRMFKSLHQCNKLERFMGWAKKVCINTCISEVEKRQKQQGIEDLFKNTSEETYDIAGLTDQDQENFHMYSTQVTPEAFMDAAETKRLLDEILEGLPQMQRLCITLWQSELSTQEIAKQLQIPTGTVKSNINYAKQKIKTQVLELEKQGTKLYGMSPIVFFVWLILRREEQAPLDTEALDGELYTHTWEKIRESISETNNATAALEYSDTAGKESLSNTKATNTSCKEENTSEGQLGASESNASSQESMAQSVEVEKKLSDAAALTGSAVAKHTASKVIIGIVTAAVVIGSAVFIGNKVSKKPAPAPEKQETVTTQSIEEILEDLKLTYIGNQQFESDSEPQAPIGCIGAYLEDLDEDGTLELLSIENRKPSYPANPTIAVYEYNGGKWALSDELNTIIHYDTKREFDSYRSHFFLKENAVIIPSNGDENECSKIVYENGSLQEESDAITKADLYREGKELCDIVCQYMSSDLLSSYADSATWKKGTAESYLINFTDYKDMNLYEADDYSFTYPHFFDGLVTFETQEFIDQPALCAVVDEKSTYVTMDMEEVELNHSLWNIRESFYSPEINKPIGDSGLIQGEDRLSYLLWTDKEDSMIVGVQGAQFESDINMLTEKGDIAWANKVFLASNYYKELPFRYTHKDGTSLLGEKKIQPEYIMEFVIESKGTVATEKKEEPKGPQSLEDIMADLGIQYIGNQLYEQTSKPQIPIGYMGAYLEDLDKDGQLELLTVENKSSDYPLTPTLFVYEYKEDAWKSVAGVEIQLKNADKEVLYRELTNGKLWFYDGMIVCSYGNDTLKPTVHVYMDEHFAGKEVDITELELYRNGKELCSIRNQYMNSDLLNSWGGMWTGEFTESYVISLIDYSKMNIYETEDYSFAYPVFFDKFVSFEEKGSGNFTLSSLSAYTDIPDPVDGKMEVWSIDKTSFEPSMAREVNPSTGLRSYGDSIGWLISQNGSTAQSITLGGDQLVIMMYLISQSQDLSLGNKSFIAFDYVNELPYYILNVDGTTPIGEEPGSILPEYHTLFNPTK